MKRRKHRRAGKYKAKVAFTTNFKYVLILETHHRLGLNHSTTGACVVASEAKNYVLSMLGTRFLVQSETVASAAFPDFMPLLFPSGELQ